jgi:hypothetical protein
LQKLSFFLQGEMSATKRNVVEKLEGIEKLLSIMQVQMHVMQVQMQVQLSDMEERLTARIEASTALRCETANLPRCFVTKLMVPTGGPAAKWTWSGIFFEEFPEASAEVLDPVQRAIGLQRLEKGRTEASARALHFQSWRGGKPAQWNGVRLDRHRFLTAAHCVSEVWDRTNGEEWVVAVYDKACGSHVPITFTAVAVDPDFVQRHGPDVAIVMCEESLPGHPHALGALRVGRPEVGDAAVIHSCFCEYDRHKAKDVVHELSSLLHCNAVGEDRAFFQGPGRTGHSGAGFFSFDGRYMGCMSEACGPRRG